MKKPVFKNIFKFTLAAGLFSGILFTAAVPTAGNKTKIVSLAENKLGARMALFSQLKLDSLGLSKDAYAYALAGLEKLEKEGKLANPDLLTIADFSLPSSKKRLFVIDLKKGEVLFNTLVSHGRNSGTAVATNFSNTPESFKSSLGFYVTGQTYKGEHGYSLRLAGEEQGINDNAMSRGIVMHSAKYVSEQIAKLQGYIGRSLGCPAIPEQVHRQIIEAIKDGTCLFLYSPDKSYMANSKMLMPTDTTIV
ncbi:murein L,D-transpeptidase catalytic domain family protein [Chitinophaga rhizophila]|uniref:Murein L,D-transpeptidase catalytic domain family protein n=1 Tax=Chitinophaga rhizophila TaxID=2866212 RepID=A0ABS7GHV7_9BACT|nr:murein L,D-transpeptidase catalytic domain family protein [Chitinophaga rhizophila]MBW8686820.1 murein L,D-transpeptidase catalytic domain family protein [Chitinophaga rhizophila]